MQMSPRRPSPMGFLVVGLLVLLAVALALEPTPATVTIALAAGMALAFVVGWTVVEWLEGEWTVPDRSGAVSLIALFVIIGAALLIDAVGQLVSRAVGRVWRLVVGVIGVGLWMGVIAAVAGAAVATHVIVGTWVLSLSGAALVWWGWRTVRGRWHERRQPAIHHQDELLARVERLQS